MRVRRQTLAADFLTEVVELFFGETPEHESTCIHAGHRMALEEHQVATVLFARCMPEPVEANVIQGRGGGIRRNVAAHIGVVAIGTCRNVAIAFQRTPGLDALFHRHIARVVRLLFGRNEY